MSLHPFHIFHFISLLLLLLLLLFLPPVFSTAPNAKTGCPVGCGDVPIPYPFGVGSHCSLNQYFNITCNTTTDPPKPYISFLKEEVIEFNQTYIRLKNPFLISACYNLSDDNVAAAVQYSDEYRPMVNLSGTPYTLSCKNRLTAVGCDDVALQFNGSVASGGCSAFCTDGISDAGGVGYCPLNASSLGNGCCQAEINRATAFLGVQLMDLSRKILRRKLFPCSYAFIQEMMNPNETIFSYPLNYLNNSSSLQNDNWASTTRPPVVRLDWMVGAENCSQAQLDLKTYACRHKKSVCVDDVNEYRGYLCNCVQGYEGNPYLRGGCKPISSVSLIAKFGCQDQCGKVSIPFPFGVGLNCSLAPSFTIICNTTTNPPKAYLANLNKEIISLNFSNVLVNYPELASTCYTFSNGITKPTKKQSLTINLVGTQYTLSDENWITAIGCDDMVVAVFGEDKQSSIRSSCAAICSNMQVDLNSFGYCSSRGTKYALGDGCCRAPIPRGTTYLEANLTDLRGQWPRTNFSCSYAFVKYNYVLHQPYNVEYPLLNNSTGITLDHILPVRDQSVLTLALDWRIGEINCKEAKRNPANFTCESNTDCVDFDATVGGYFCKCSDGYDGNPYLEPGCLDIDECTDNTTNTCTSNSICINDVGSYHCSCSKGYFGDGKKDGTGCIQLPPSKSKMIISIGLGSGLGFLLLLLLCIWLYKVWQKKKGERVKEKFFKRNGGLLLQQQENQGVLGQAKVFPSKELEVATDNFNESRIIGHGGQGTVYKGMLSNGKIVAIKKSKLVEENQLEQFINEVVILSQINHRNVVKLLGCCLETEVPLLVYEFMPNGTLFDLIHDPNNEIPFTWNMRLKIAADIAGALAYLHSASSIPIYHRDIKSGNILLDEKFVVKVADFGTSRSVAPDQTHLTTLVQGTFGYLDPEYFQSCQFTEKSDVYSFGVVLVELLSGQRAVSSDKTEDERGLAARFLTCMDENCLDMILDSHVWEEGGKEDVIVVARLAQRCLNLRGKMRPTMKEVATELENFRISQMPSTSKDEDEDEVEGMREFEDMPTTISDGEYTWTGSYKSGAASSSSDTQPLRFA